MLKMKKIKLELIPDPDTYICSLKKVEEVEFLIFSNRYNKSSNKYLKFYDPKQESKHIIYLDANNLYGYAMSTFFLTSGFKQIDPEDLNKYTSNSSRS